jgi:hypothetical protein
MQLVKHTGDLSGHAVWRLAVVVNPGCLGTASMPLLVGQGVNAAAHWVHHRQAQLESDTRRVGLPLGIGEGRRVDAHPHATHLPVGQAGRLQVTVDRVLEIRNGTVGVALHGVAGRVMAEHQGIGL